MDHLRIKIIFAVVALAVIVQPFLLLSVSALEDNCPIGLTIRADKSVITDLSHTITFTVEARRFPPAGDSCTSRDEITSYVVFKDINKQYGPIRMTIPVESGTSLKSGTAAVTIAGSGATVKQSYEFYAVGSVARYAGEKPAVNAQLAASSTVRVQYNAPGAKDGNQIFFSDSSGKDFGSGATVKKGTTGYKIIAKVSEQSSPKNYWIRVTRLIDGKKDGDNYLLVIPETSPSGTTDGTREQTFSKPITFPKTGNYTFYLDYRDATTPEFVAINSTSISVTESGSTPGTTPGANSNSNTTPRPNTNTGISNTPDYDSTALGEFSNPLTIGSVPEIVARVIRILLALVGMLAIVVIILAGFRMVTQGDNPAQVTKARNAITWAILGLLAALLSFSIVSIVQRIIER